MASPATAAFQSTTPGTSIPSASSTSNSPFIQEEANSKATYSSKLGSAKGRQQLDNTNTGAVQSRQSPMQKVAVSGSNPNNHRTANPNQRNGATTATNPYPQGPTAASSPALLREGLKVKITLDNGAEYEGTYSCGSDNLYTLKMVQQRKVAPGEFSNGTTKVNREPLATMSFQKKDVADIHVTGASLPPKEFRSQNGSSLAFRTDSAISGNRFQGERPLKRWTPEDNVEADISLESSRNKTTSGPTWDQFEANERLFGLKTDYDENMYTTAIDKSHPDYSKRYAEADRKAREIESNIPQNSHIAEERIVDHLDVDDSGLDEEEKYSGVQRGDQPSMLPIDLTGALTKGNVTKADKYQPPGRRANAAVSTNNVPLVDPAIISSSVGARKSSPVTEKMKSNNIKNANASHTTQNATKPFVAADVTTTGSKPEVTQDMNATSANPILPASTSQTAHTQARQGGGANVAATVVRDVTTAFKTFASQQRFQADKMRNNKARQDKEVKLHELRRFAASFKLNSPVPSDLVSIIAKDPAKQREIQEKAKRNAEEQAEQLKQVKLNAEAAGSASTGSDFKATQRPSAVSPHGGVSTPGSTSRQNIGRAQAFLPQGPHTSQSFRSERPNQGQNISLNAQGRPGPGLGARLRNLEQNRNGQASPHSQHDLRQPPIGPANSVEPGFSRRSSGAISMMGNKLNPNINEFKPNPSAASFSPNGNRSAGSSPRSNSTGATTQLVLVQSGSLVRRKRLQTPGKPSNEYDIVESAALVQPPAGSGKRWDGNGGVKPAYDTPPTFRQIGENEPAESSMHQTYIKLFESTPYPNQTMSPPHPPHVHPHVPHQHQLPFHLQQGPHNLSQRQSPRQPQIHLHNNQHSHGPSLQFNPTDDHRMIPSHSAQSFASPRLQPVSMAYPSPMGQPAQLAYSQPSMQYPIAPGGPQMAQYRSYSGGHQFLPQQAPHMAGPVMIPAPAANGFITPGGIVSPAPQMIYPAGQPHFVPQGNGPSQMPGPNGYPSPGRSAPMTMTQSSQPGQPVYGMSPGVQYGQPIYTQQQPSPMPNMRGYASQGQQQFGTSPQMHQYGTPHRGAPNAGYNKNYQPQHNPHPSQNPAPTGTQAQQPEAGEDAK